MFLREEGFYLDIVVINIAVEIFSICVSLLIILSMVLSNDRKEKLNLLFIGMLTVNVGVLASDLITWIFYGDTTPNLRTLLQVANFFVYSLGYIILGLFIAYLVTYISRYTYISKKVIKISTILCLAAILLVVVSQFNHMYYEYDAQNVYKRGSMYWISQAYPIGMMIMGMYIVIKYRKTLGRKETIALLSYGVCPIVAMTIQIVIYGITLLYVSTTFTMLIIYLTVQMEMEKKLKRQEAELMQSHISIMLSQIQPHFIYNTLTTIRSLCPQEATEARKTIEMFSEYLRGNMASLSQTTPIHFEEELYHTQNFLKIEKIRFGDRLSVIYDIKSMDFLIPALTIQPLVENAVKHGILVKPKGGYIKVSSRENENYYFITVSDDGVGFDTKVSPKDGRVHIGISNVRSRLQAQMRGELRMESTIGIGSVATIIIPKGGNHIEGNSHR